MLKLTTDKHEASRGLPATAELLVYSPSIVTTWYCLQDYSELLVKICKMFIPTCI